MLRALILAGQGFDPTNPISWLSYGGVGAAVVAVIVLFQREWIVPGPSHRRVVDIYKDQIAIRDQANIELAKKNEELHELIENKAMDTLARAGQVMGDTLDLLKERRIRGELERERHDPR